MSTPSNRSDFPKKITRAKKACHDKSKLSESDIQKQIIKWLLTSGYFCWRNNTVGVYDPVKKIYRKNNAFGSINGVSDILGIMKDGRLLAIEVKKKGGKPSLDQRIFLSCIARKGGVAMIVDSLEVAISLVTRAEGMPQNRKQTISGESLAPGLPLPFADIRD